MELAVREGNIRNNCQISLLSVLVDERFRHQMGMQERDLACLGGNEYGFGLSPYHRGD